MNKKICHLTSVHNIDDIRIFHKECTSLAAKGFDVTLIACGDNSAEYVKNGVSCISLCFPVRNRIQRFIMRSKAVYLKALEVNADIYHFHDPELFLISVKLKKKGKKVIYDAHEDLPSQVLYKGWIPSLLRKPVSLVINYLELYYSKKIDGIVTVNSSIADRLNKKNKNITVCYNYASKNEFGHDISKSTVRKENVCYIGSLSKIRGIFEAVQAASISGVKIELAGDFESEEFARMVSGNNVIYHGVVNRETIKEIFSRCFAGIVTFLPSPNHINSSPNKLFEYMAAGIPVIASNFRFWKNMVEDNNIGLTADPSDINEIAGCIKYLKNNPDIAKKMGENGRMAFENKYNWQGEEKKLLDFYNNILS